MSNSILTSVKKILGITEAYTHFDQDVIMHINTVFTILHQIGVGPDEGFAIEDSTATWSDYIDDNLLLENVKSYVALRVRKMFDPPTNSTVLNAINDTINELEFRINITVDPEED